MYLIALLFWALGMMFVAPASGATIVMTPQDEQDVVRTVSLERGERLVVRVPMAPRWSGWMTQRALPRGEPVPQRGVAPSGGALDADGDTVYLTEFGADSVSDGSERGGRYTIIYRADRDVTLELDLWGYEENSMNRILIWLAITVAIAFALPFAAVRFRRWRRRVRPLPNAPADARAHLGLIDGWARRYDMERAWGTTLPQMRFFRFGATDAFNARQEPAVWGGVVDGVEVHLVDMMWDRTTRTREGAPVHASYDGVLDPDEYTVFYATAPQRDAQAFVLHAARGTAADIVRQSVDGAQGMGLVLPYQAMIDGDATLAPMGTFPIENAKLRRRFGLFVARDDGAARGMFLLSPRTQELMVADEDLMRSLAWLEIGDGHILVAFRGAVVAGKESRLSSHLESFLALRSRMDGVLPDSSR